MANRQPALALLKKTVPFIAKNAPKLWPLLLDAKNREKVIGLAREIAASSPKRKLGAKIEVTELLARSMADQAGTEPERVRAEAWQRRAHKMRIRLDMPVEGTSARRRHRAALRHDLGRLHDEITEALRDEEPPPRLAT